MSGGYDVDYDSDCDVYDYDDDYIYADAGAYDLADELASGAIAEAPALYYRDDEYEEYDNYNFWSEIEYGNGEIFDQDIAPQQHSTADNQKKSRADDIKDTIKKIRLRGIQDYPSVLWKSSHEAFSLNHNCPVYEKPQQPTALLPNWRQLLKDRPAVFTTSYMAIHSAKIDKEEAEWEDMSEDDAESDQDDDDDDEEEEDQDEDGQDGEEGMGLQDIDPEMLKSALAARLSASGMTGKDQSSMMEAMMQMLAGGGGAGIEDLLESLTSNMVNQVTEEGGDSSMGQWLSGQGVSLEEENDDNESGSEEKNEDTRRPSEDVTSGASQDSSPQDSVAAGLPAAPKSSVPSTEALLEPPSTGKKRKHPLSEEIKQDDETEEPAPEPAHIHKRSKKDVPKPSNGSARSKPAARQSATSQPKVKIADDKPSVKPKTDVPVKPKAEATKSTKPRPTASHEKANTSSTTSIAKPITRKRKAADEQVPEEKPKRQLRNFAAPTASSQSKTADTKAPDTKTTRSGRARK
ncbi:hypothetical protein M436DRAFT_78321 [Aureobasidium namibiae CBS 147.97]|uniref:Uncharacterized protein n=1 Tax=Aureobasidium namibiae CBS 147.97 TaxID=1043004 RepID=A0A074X3I5_9PEZI